LAWNGFGMAGEPVKSVERAIEVAGQMPGMDATRERAVGWSRLNRNA
jgi:hypothetical protein